MRVGVTGHQSMDDDVRLYVRWHMEKVLSELSAPLIGLSSLAAGADQLFATAVLAHHGSLTVVIPSDRYESTFSHHDDLRSYFELLSHASSVEKMSYAEPSESAFLAAGKYIVQQSEIVVAVWDGKPARGSGGTADIVQFALEQGRQVFIIWPAGVIR